jgi:hypothetical protein
VQQRCSSKITPPIGRATPYRVTVIATISMPAKAFALSVHLHHCTDPTLFKTTAKGAQTEPMSPVVSPRAACRPLCCEAHCLVDARLQHVVVVTEPPKIVPYYRLSLSTWPLSNNKELFCRFRRVKPGKSHTTGSLICAKPTRRRDQSTTLHYIKVHKFIACVFFKLH